MRHSRYAFVLQSLTLWREIANDMFRLWYLAEEDLLRSSNPYEQRDTGQGLQRVQNAPRTSRAMHQLLHSTQTKGGPWVGSSLIHLGDSNVPNALMFIDKYSQVQDASNTLPDALILALTLALTLALALALVLALALALTLALILALVLALALALSLALALALALAQPSCL